MSEIGGFIVIVAICSVIGIVIGAEVKEYQTDSKWETKLIEKDMGEYKVENGELVLKLKECK